MLPKKKLMQLYQSQKLACSFNEEECKAVRKELLGWYDAHRRALPWRGDKIEEHVQIPSSPYGTWISEIMLQQTRVQTVISYWFRWMDRFPTIEKLAKASSDEVNALWAGLGYYRRAAQILSCAKLLVDEYEGKLPEKVDDLLKLPGIGPYTAGAISSISFGHVAALVDGNVIRVLSRLRAMDETGAKLDKSCWKLMHSLVDPRRPGDFNQAIMELGATVCKPTSPLCESCPVRSFCHAYALVEEGAPKVIDIEDVAQPAPSCVTEFPRKTPKKKPKEMLYSVVVIRTRIETHGENKYLMIRRPPKGLLKNQWEFPSSLHDLESFPAEFASFSLCEKRQYWFPRAQSTLQQLFAFHIEELGASHNNPQSVDCTFYSKDAYLHPEPLIHIFSHQKHIMYVVEATIDTEFCVTTHGCNDTLEINYTTQGSGSREASWMTLDELKRQGITTGVKKIIALTESRRASGSNSGKKGKLKVCTKGEKRQKIDDYFLKHQS